MRKLIVLSAIVLLAGCSTPKPVMKSETQGTIAAWGHINQGCHSMMQDESIPLHVRLMVYQRIQEEEQRAMENVRVP